MTRERACLACAGQAEHVVRRADADPEKPILRSYYTREEALASLCPACLGTGRQTDAITAQDAIADAETLRAIRQPKQDAPFVLHMPRMSIREAWLFGLEWTCAAFPDAQTAYHAARAAFRAVPALREES